jgi:tetratricopeptide (TPR) repeat protein
VTEQPGQADIGRATHDLDAESFLLLELVGEHPGAQFTADPLAVALDVPTARVERDLEQLVKAQLVVQVMPGRYGRYDSMCTRLGSTADRRAAALRRTRRRSMIEWYLRRTVAADLAIKPRLRRFSPVYEQQDAASFSNAQSALGWFNIERGNVLMAQCLAAEEGWDGLVYQFAEAAWNPLRLGYFADDVVNTQRLGTVAARQCGHLLEVVFLARLGLGESDRGRHDAATTACTTAVDRATAFDTWVLASALSARAAVFTGRGQPRAALADLAHALLLDEDRGDRYDIAVRHLSIGQAYAHPEIADFSQAVWHLRTSAELLEALDDPIEHARAITNLAEVHLNAQQPDAALFALRRIERAVTHCGSIRHQTHAYTVMGRVHAQLGNHNNASNYYAIARELLDTAGPGAAHDRAAILVLQGELGTREP